MTPQERSSTVAGWCALLFAMIFPSIMAWVYFVAIADEGRGARGEGREEEREKGRKGKGERESKVSRERQRPEEEQRTTNNEQRTNFAVQSAYGAGKVIQFAFPLLFVWIYERRLASGGRQPPVASPLSSLLNLFAPRGLFWGIGFGLLTTALILLLYHGGLREPLLQLGLAERVREKTEAFGAATPGRFLLLAVFLSGMHSLMEEYYWRWFVFGRLKRLAPLLPAIVLSGLAFMAHHVIILYVFLPGRFLSAVVPFSLAIAVGGCVWAWLYQRTGSLASPWLSHAIVDAAIMAVGYDLLFG